MSKERRNDSFDSILKIMTEAQLNELLRAELMNEDTDVELIKRVNAALATRAEDSVDFDIDKSWEDFVSNHADTEPIYSVDPSPAGAETRVAKGRRRSKRAMVRAAALAAVLVLLIGCATAYAIKPELWDAFASWTAEHFSFSPTSQDNLPNGADIDLSELQSLLDSQGVSADVIPTYITDKYDISEIIQHDITSKNKIVCSLSDGEKYIMLQYIIRYSQDSGMYPKDEVNPEIYKVDNIEHYIFLNNDSYLAIWYVDDIECSISGVADKTELLKMIDSIYRR